ncbi:hypothetical protein Shyd_82610 [Streptomyces hydrogenans]|uniref:Uncharacterized protein n=1 Tax=Streptomyces hydrogenans TaxID=1873719 RepID=A0ABQ3PH94_9ACTN|nr:hypothetical protein GCM10018784_36120 [Streptomyces hydrogenans]GHI20390.1 hypothetical protein Shyd_17610 [Streptomyces hydrogenans]GHI20401.1 hypothetical protein Shyd_17720 [Streptomyces hydrogenans]GHI22791.1 hypothetical protein Shyd_41620 [Streptomyces hydrogenans]GHI22805.1 hypothetical protein Shyd_41760 [Streptomyces hydrogenans]
MRVRITRSIGVSRGTVEQGGKCCAPPTGWVCGARAVAGRPVPSPVPAAAKERAGAGGRAGRSVPGQRAAETTRAMRAAEPPIRRAAPALAHQ